MQLFDHLGGVLILLASLAACLTAPAARADEVSEFRLKAAFIYNFVALTEWPNENGDKLQLCIVGANPFGEEINKLNGRMAGTRAIAVQYKTAAESIKGCHAAYIAAAHMASLPQLLEPVKGRPLLVISDSPGPARPGVALNLVVLQDRVGFEVNLQAARDARLTLDSKLLRVAAKVYP